MDGRGGRRGKNLSLTGQEDATPASCCRVCVFASLVSVVVSVLVRSVLWIKWTV